MLSALMLSAFLFFVPSCNAQTQFPDTPTGDQTKTWLENFNAGDRAKYKEFFSKNFPTRVDRADRDIGFREATGGFDLKKIEESTPTKLVALVQERSSDQIARLTVEVDASDQHLITRLDLQAIPRPAEFALPHQATTALLDVRHTLGSSD